MFVNDESIIKHIDNIIIDGRKAEENFKKALKLNKKRDLRIPPLFTKTEECIGAFEKLKTSLSSNELKEYHIDNVKVMIKDCYEEKRFLNELYDEWEPWENNGKFGDEIAAYLEWIHDLVNIEDTIENLRKRCVKGQVMVNNIGNVQIQNNVVNSSQSIVEDQIFDYDTVNTLVSNIDSMIECIREEFKDRADELLELNNILREKLTQKDRKGINETLKKIGEIAKSVGCGVSANGITAIINKLL